MPRYDYKCKKCHKKFEVTHGINENVIACEFCGGHVRRVFHPVGIVFKGSGFYANDSKRSGNNLAGPDKAEKDKPEKAAAGEKAKEKKETKPKDSVKAPS